MSKIELYRKKSEELEKLQAEIKKLQQSQALKKEMDFVKAIESVLKKYGKKPADLMNHFGSGAPVKKSKAAASNRQRKQSPERSFKHPETGEVLKVRRTNNKTLKQWASDLGVTIEQLEV